MKDLNTAHLCSRWRTSSGVSRPFFIFRDLALRKRVQESSIASWPDHLSSGSQILRVTFHSQSATCRHGKGEGDGEGLGAADEVG